MVIPQKEAPVTSTSRTQIVDWATEIYEDLDFTAAKQWLDDQGIDEYNEMGELWKEISFHRFFQQNEDGLPPEKLDMLFLATHDLDKFKRFIFECYGDHREE